MYKKNCVFDLNLNVKISEFSQDSIIYNRLNLLATKHIF
jgi:hypothetical protein